MSFPRYEKYKDSGVEWLGEVPEGWEAGRFSRVISRIKDGTHGSFERVTEGKPLLSAKNVQEGCLHIEEDESQISESDHISIVANGFPRKGDLLLTIVGTIGRSCVYDFEYALSFQRSVCFIRLRSGNDPKFFYYFTQSKFFQEQLVSKSKSAAQGGVYMGDVVATRLASPPLPEQRTIAAFLDHETGKIDALVAEQEKLIGLLKEKRQAVISHAVTKGLDPNARMKDSGVEWLGEVPEGWEVKRLKSLVAEPLKYGANEAAEIDDPMLPRFVRITDIDDKGGLRDETFKSLPVEVAEPYLLKEGDVLLARSGATVGKSFIYSKHWGTACFAGYLIRARLDCSYCLAQWLYYFCQTNEYWGYIVGSQIQATIQNVSAEKYANLYLPIPSTKEQRTIAAFLDHETTQIDALIEEAKKAIELMKERRTALISAAVTGKIDLRGRV